MIGTQLTLRESGLARLSDLVHTPARFRSCALNGGERNCKETGPPCFDLCGSCEISSSPKPWPALHTFHFNILILTARAQFPVPTPPPSSIRRAAEVRGPYSASVCGRQEGEGVQGTGQGLLIVKGNNHPFKPLRNCFLPSRFPVTKAT